VKVRRNPETVHPPLGGYVHQVELTGETRLIALAGQVGMRPDGTLPEAAEEQLREALRNVERNLEAASMTLRDVVKLTIYAVGELDRDLRASVLGGAFGDEPPAMTLVFVASLATPQLRVELDAWASA
jgi:enamine deaminase RidA (YjgF/YER057c/UK114 family)